MIRNILEYAEETAKRMPDAVAFATDKEEKTFGQLVQRAKEIGSALLSYGVKNAPMAVMTDKTPDMIAAFLGCVYSGNFYTPIDVTMPKERILSIFETLKPVVLLIDEKSKKQAAALGYTGETLVLEETPEGNVNEEALAEVRRKAIDTDPLYALFTSGSTGVPKGVVISHQAVVNLTEWYTETFSITEKEVIGNQAPFYFDSSVKDIYAVLKTGARMEIIPKMLFSFPVKLLPYLEEKKINYIDWVPSALCIIANTDALEKVRPSYLQKIMFVGEAMPTKQFNYWRRHYPDAMFANIYGPTETTVDCTYYIVDREFADDEPVPELRIVEQDVVLFKPRRVHRIVVVGVIPDLDVRGRHHIFDIAGCAVFVWKNRVGVRKPHAADGLIHDVSSCFLFTASTTSSPGGLPQPPHASF